MGKFKKIYLGAGLLWERQEREAEGIVSDCYVNLSVTRVDFLLRTPDDEHLGAWWEKSTEVLMQINV